MKFAADNLSKAKVLYYPTNFTSKAALVYAASPFKNRFPELFEAVG